MAVPSNILLASLPRKAYLRVLSALAPVSLDFGRVLHRSGESLRHVYFPSACLVSLLLVVDARSALEVGLVGREGMVGVGLALGARSSPMRALVQGAGTAMRMTRACFLAALDDTPTFRRQVELYAHSLMQQIAQSAACNRFHFVKPRLARWLLMTRDRVGSGEFRMTQQFLSNMLGVRRVGVTQAASALQRRKLIEYSRGRITILDHAGLEKASCSCYARPAAPRRRASGPA